MDFQTKAHAEGMGKSAIVTMRRIIHEAAGSFQLIQGHVHGRAMRLSSGLRRVAAEEGCRNVLWVCP